MTITRLFIGILGVAAMSAAFGQTTTTTGTREYAFPAIGIGSGEVVQVDVLNVASNSSSGTAASCTGSVAFRNGSGAAIGSSTAFTVTSGQIASARVPFSTAASTGVRTVVRPVVTLNISTATPRPPCSLEFTLEIYDATTGATRQILPGGGLSGNGGGGPRF